MIDQLHTYRSRDSVAGQERRQASRSGTDDTLAELARLIGQRANGYRYTTHNPATSRADRGWPPLAAENADPAQRQQGDVAPLRSPRSESYVAVSRGRSDGEEPSSSRYFSGLTLKFNGAHEDGEHPATVDNVQSRHHQQPVSPSGDNAPPVSPRDQVPAFLLRASADQHDAHTQSAETGKVYGADDYYVDDRDLRRGNGLLVVMAMLALAALAVSGTFVYRAMFGASALSTTSAIVKTGNWLNKVSAYDNDQRSDSSQTLIAGTDASEKLASLEEQPLDLQGLPKTALRVGSTMPISQNSTSPLLDAPGSAAVAPSGPAPAPTLASPEHTAESAPQVAAPGLPQPKKIHTVAISSKGSDFVGEPPTVPTVEFVSPLAPAPIPAPGSSEPKKVRTIAIRSAGSHPTDPAVMAGTSTSARSASAAAAPPVGPQVSPTLQDSVHSRKTVGTGSAAAASSHRGYAVQVASESSAADAHTVFRSLQTKFPKQLGKREAIVRRSDLGVKGIHYRAMIGPFASMEDATHICSALKAAGGNCLVQRN